MAKRGPSKARSVFAELKVFRTPDAQLNMNRAVHVAGHLGEAKEAAQRYRTAVLAHPDLAKRLCAIFGYTDPERWSGNVPPRLDEDDQYNSSPHRFALVPIVVEALERVGDHKHYDNERLNQVPVSAVREPWKETPEVMRAKAQAARLESLMAEEDENR